jgi:hypothetical protein
MTRHTVLNPSTGRYVFKTGVLGQKIMKKKPVKKKDKKPDKRTYITFKTQSAMITAQDMVDAGFECEKVIAVLAFDGNKKKLLTSRDDGTPYWSTKKAS